MFRFDGLKNVILFCLVIFSFIVNANQSKKAFEISQSFIDDLSQIDYDKNGTVYVSRESLSESQQQALMSAVVENIESLKNREGADNFNIIGRGHYAYVYEYNGVPGVVFKIMDNERVKSEQRANSFVRDIIRDNNLYFIKAPWSLVEELTGGRGLFMQEKLDLPISGYAQKEAWAYVADHYRNNKESLFAKNFEEFFRQSCLLIIKSGYWDVSTDNFPLMSKGEYRVNIIDFDNMNKGKNSSIKEGIQRLLDMFPFESLRTIAINAIWASEDLEESAKSKLSGKFKVDEEDLNILLSALKYYKTTNFSSKITLRIRDRDLTDYAENVQEIAKLLFNNLRNQIL